MTNHLIISQTQCHYSQVTFEQYVYGQVRWIYENR